MTQLIERPFGFDDAVPDVETLSMAQAINRALSDAMLADDRVLVFGRTSPRSAVSSA